MGRVTFWEDVDLGYGLVLGYGPVAAYHYAVLHYGGEVIHGELVLVA